MPLGTLYKGDAKCRLLLYARARSVQRQLYVARRSRQGAEASPIRGGKRMWMRYFVDSWLSPLFNKHEHPRHSRLFTYGCTPRPSASRSVMVAVLPHSIKKSFEPSRCTRPKKIAPLAKQSSTEPFIALGSGLVVRVVQHSKHLGI